MAGTREIAIKNLRKAGPSGPGRPKLTEQQKEHVQIKRQALLDYYAEYLKSGEAVEDFKKAKQKQTLASLQEATERVHGKVSQKVEVDAEININLTKYTKK